MLAYLCRYGGCRGLCVACGTYPVLHTGDATESLVECGPRLVNVDPLKTRPIIIRQAHRLSKYAATRGKPGNSSGGAVPFLTVLFSNACAPGTILLFHFSLFSSSSKVQSRFFLIQGFNGLYIERSD